MFKEERLNNVNFIHAGKLFETHITSAKNVNRFNKNKNQFTEFLIILVGFFILTDQIKIILGQIL
jgi:hypothetical protein